MLESRSTARTLQIDSFLFLSKAKIPLLLPMDKHAAFVDINLGKFTNNAWGLDLAMEEQILHDHHLPFDAVWPSCPLPTHSISAPSSSTQVAASVLLGDQIGNLLEENEEPEEELGAMKEMMYKIAAMQPVDIDPATIRKPKRRNVRISDDPQSVAARHRRERISEKIRILQRLVPGGTKMDTASMLDEAIRYVKFLKRQIRQLQSNHHPSSSSTDVTACLSAPDWAVTSTKLLGSSSSSSMEALSGGGFSFRAP